ncbi:MAG: hypothetical protein LBF37_00390 [Rickettsiales bacterium]|jgi:hypothetical protein|nr:hypothetical protein [Rickettsiales bacterium]
MRKYFTSFTILFLSVSGALAQVTVKDPETIDKSDIAIQSFEETDMAPVGLIQHKISNTFIKPKEGSVSSLGDIVSISVNSRDDLNMEGYLETSDTAVRPGPIIIPLLENYPIQDIEVKFRLFNQKF